MKISFVLTKEFVVTVLVPEGMSGRALADLVSRDSEELANNYDPGWSVAVTSKETGPEVAVSDAQDELVDPLEATWLRKQ